MDEKLGRFRATSLSQPRARSSQKRFGAPGALWSKGEKPMMTSRGYDDITAGLNRQGPF